VRPVYAPALVAFVGGNGFSLSVNIGSAPDVAWFPLAPGEIYRPYYQASSGYYNSVNVSNTKIVNVTNITNIYNNPAAVNQVNYKYRQQPLAVTAVSAQTFARAEPVGRAQLAVNREALQRARIVEAAPVAPVAASVIGGAPRATAKPRDELKQKPTIAHAAPPAPTAPFAQREATLKEAASAGKPHAAPERTANAPMGRREGPTPVVMAQPNAKAQPLPPAKAGGEALPPRGMAQGEGPRRAEAPAMTPGTKGPDKGAENAASAPPTMPPGAAPQKGPERDRAASAPPPPQPRGMAQESAPPPSRAMTQDKAPKGPDRERAASAPPPPRAMPPESASQPPSRAMTQEQPPQREPQAKAPPPPREPPQARAPAPQPAPERAASAPPPPRAQVAPQPQREPQAKAPPPPREQPQARAPSPQQAQQPHAPGPPPQSAGGRREAPATAEKGKDKEDEKKKG